MLNFPRWKVALILLVCFAGLALAFPNLLSERTRETLPTWLPHNAVNLGLDLRGGSYLLLEVDFRAAHADRLANLADTVRTRLREVRIGYINGPNVDGDRVSLTIRDVDRLEEARRILRELEAELEVNVADNGQTVLRYSDRALDAWRRAAVEQSIEIVRRRVDETGTKEPTIQRQGEDRILVQLPGIDDPERVKALLGRTANMTFRLVDTTVSLAEAKQGRLPPGSEILPSAEAARPGQPSEWVVRKRVMVSGDTLTDAQATFQNNEPVVSFKFDSAGARRFGEATRENVGRPFAIVLDGKVISAPVIREPILGGSGIISGSFTVQSAQDLALLLRAGALPAPLTILEERTVGPDLGADSIVAGQRAIAFGFVLICILMIVGYGLFGIFANIALLLNLILTIAVMSLLEATLTLPGLAGMVLGLAMAVDANVLIYERMREEADRGLSPIAAADAGFKRAFLTIFDSNLTTLIAAALLYAFGSGPVRGFAVTLSIGLIASMFTAISVTRLMVVTWLRMRRRTALPI